MRTTITFDPDVEVLVKQTVREQRRSFKQVLNNALRAGLGKRDNTAVAPFRQRSFNHGRPRVDLTKALSLAGELDDQRALARYRA